MELDEGTVFPLKRHLEDLETERDEWEEGYQDQDLVFCHPDGSPYDPTWTTKSFEKLTVGLPSVRPIRFHHMRHTHATMLLKEGYSTRYVAERLGDREDTIIETYAHVRAKSRRRAV